MSNPPTGSEKLESFEDLITLAASKAKGKRPSYASDPMVDHLVSMVAALATELSVARERADTLERLLEIKASLSATKSNPIYPIKTQVANANNKLLLLPRACSAA